MPALTFSQIELLRRLDAGQPLHQCGDIPRFLDEVVLMSRLKLVKIDADGTPRIAGGGKAYLGSLPSTAGLVPLEPPPPPLAAPRPARGADDRPSHLPEVRPAGDATAV